MPTRISSSSLVRFGLCAFAASICLSVSGADIAEGLAGVGALALLLKERRSLRFSSSLEAPIWIYLGTGILVSLLGQAPRVSLTILPSDLHKVALFYVASAALALDRSAPLHRWYAASCLAAVLLGVYQVAGHLLAPSLNAASFGGIRLLASLVPTARAHGTVHPVTYGEMMAIASLGGLCWYAVPSRLGERDRLLAGGFALAALVGMVLSQTRGAWLALACSAALIAVFRRETRRLAVRAAIAGGAAIAIVSTALQVGFQSRFLSIFDTHVLSNAIRFELWKIALRVFQDHPLTGVGVGNYLTVFNSYHPSPVGDIASWGNAHNGYLHQLAERGLLGEAALLLLLGTFVWKPYVRYRADPKPVHLWAFAAAAAWCVMNLTETAIQDAMVWMPMIFLYVLSERTALDAAGSGLHEPARAGARPVRL